MCSAEKHLLMRFTPRPAVAKLMQPRATGRREPPVEELSECHACVLGTNMAACGGCDCHVGIVAVAGVLQVWLQPWQRCIHHRTAHGSHCQPNSSCNHLGGWGGRPFGNGAVLCLPQVGVHDWQAGAHQALGSQPVCSKGGWFQQCEGYCVRTPAREVWARQCAVWSTGGSKMQSP